MAIAHFSASLIDCPLPKRGKRKFCLMTIPLPKWEIVEREKKIVFGNLNAENRREFFLLLNLGKDT